ncbi:sulfatase-like hydrolase/transferase [Rubinisphaera brasiliensis]|uniref:Cerebroside-sulfatase, N-acetylgalactosamine-6-sulfatase n=1 Tax=Rubinisphaera brasiliensis (strain ATCC 49424 / DSM 5305 / JCM 21570 / IAM 15109 / NBRC 103401 / IFAM 1448) TaxID=756272 RepID=F0SIV7_RUBBR|nr:sulfatase-like hydrolase/transferase [Rubinisphaera brasiliensis]ADY61806.1 Cerebroside-sulfatase,N-acetylgalactosamine-6-sulfatase [Rubinisphaera brasiliensis DSM 5305]
MISRIPRCLLVVACLLTSLCMSAEAEETAAASQQQRSQPNIVLILADDLAPGDLSQGDGEKARTPRLDQLAKESVQFTQAYSASCVCAPARAALLTGRYPHRTGVVTLNLNKYPMLTRLHRDEVTIADILKEAGYATGLIGKWHTGRGEGYHPLDRGFEEFEGFDGSVDVGYYAYPFIEQRTTHTVTDQYLTDDLTQRAINFVRRHQNEPFFLKLAHYAPHRPLEAPEELIQHYRDRGFDASVATIYAMIEVMDRGIGRLLDEIDALGLAEETIVLFASDNGPDPLTGERFNLELRGSKYQVYEGGLRVPLLIRWTNQVIPGVRDQMVSFVDLLPTLLELCNVELEAENPLDGESFASVLHDGNAEFSPTRFWQWNRGEPNYTHNAALRDGKFKLVRPYVTRGVKLQDSTLKPVLYDLEADPAETEDVAQQHPGIYERMTAELQQLSKNVEQDRTRPDSSRKDVTASEQQPNIVLLLADDLGWSDLHCYGHPYHRTPNLDQLAQEGMRYTNGYAPAPICSASRASILTGKTPARLNFEFVTKTEAGPQRLDTEVPLQTPPLTLNLPPSETTIAESLAGLDYQTAFFGKWHVSQHYGGRYLAWHPEFGPQKQGFQIATEDFGDHPYAWGRRQPPALPDGQFPLDSMVQRTADFIRSQKNADEPYFVMASYFYVHTPVKNRCRWLVDDYEQHLPAGTKNRKQRLEYAAFVETLDHHVGTILQAIDEAGQRENTLVIFLSDNGGHPEYCANAPLRGSKWNLYEGGIRVPFIARWPKTIAAASVCETPVVGYDLLPTLVDVAGGTAAVNNSDLVADEVDGISVRETFTDPDWNPNRSLIWHFPYYHPETTYSKAIDEIGIDDFATSKTRPQSAIRDRNYKLLQFAEDDRLELYDLNQDISEQHDLSQQQPQLARELRESLEQQLNSMNARRALPKP